MSVCLYGKPVAEALDAKTARQVQSLKERHMQPALGILRVGEKADDLTYERAIARRTKALGIELQTAAFPADVHREDVLSQILRWNDDGNIHGILLLRPLPAEMEDPSLLDAVAPEKDVDGVTRSSMAGVYAGAGEGFAPCTAEACIALLDHYGVEMAGKRAVVVGRSLVIGRPVAALLTARDATVTLCHSRTAALRPVIQSAELVIAALGRAEFLRGEDFSAGQTVLDVGIHFSDVKQKLVGDINTAEAATVVQAITPVPGGVGSVTTSVLCRHVVQAAERIG